jgi:hypothetical protein
VTDAAIGDKVVGVLEEGIWVPLDPVVGDKVVGVLEKEFGCW